MKGDLRSTNRPIRGALRHTLFPSRRSPTTARHLLPRPTSRPRRLRRIPSRRRCEACRRQPGRTVWPGVAPRARPRRRHPRRGARPRRTPRAARPGTPAGSRHRRDRRATRDHPNVRTTPRARRGPPRRVRVATRARERARHDGRSCRSHRGDRRLQTRARYADGATVVNRRRFCASCRSRHRR